MMMMMMILGDTMEFLAVFKLNHEHCEANTDDKSFFFFF